MSPVDSTGIPTNQQHMCSLQPYGEHAERNKENASDRSLKPQCRQEGERHRNAAIARPFKGLGVHLETSDYDGDKDEAHRRRLQGGAWRPRASPSSAPDNWAWLSPEPTTFSHIHHSKKTPETPIVPSQPTTLGSKTRAPRGNEKKKEGPSRDFSNIQMAQHPP